MAGKVYTGVEAIKIQVLKTGYRVSLYRKDRKGLLADTTISVNNIRLSGNLKVLGDKSWPDGRPVIEVEFTRARKVKVDEFGTLKVGY